MTPEQLAQQPTGFMAWFAQYGQIVYVIVNIAFWIGMLLFVGYAVVQYKRWVNFQMGVGKSGKLRDAGTVVVEKSDKSEPVKVEEFVD